MLFRGFGTEGIWDDVKGRTSATKTYLFEISHEVAKKSGGIYTVLSSKALVTVREWGDRLVSTFNNNKFLSPQVCVHWPIHPCYRCFGVRPIGPHEVCRETDRELEGKAWYYCAFWPVACKRFLCLTCYCSQNEGYPRCFLIDPKSSASNLAKWRQELQPGFANENDTEANDAIIFGFQVKYCCVFSLRF